MKVISLNTWNGMRINELLYFFRKNSDVDAFLLQEVLHRATSKTAWKHEETIDLFDKIQGALPNYKGFFAPSESNEWGLAIFIKKDISIIETGDIFVFRHRDAMIEGDGSTLGKNLQYLIIEINGKKLNLLNFHGLWNGQGKIDTEDRISQSQRVVEFVQKLNGGIILSGDFNLRPDTKSIKIIEDDLNLENLITKYNISSTRTSFYEKEEKFADYTLVSSDIEVGEFKVLPDEVSDHAALFLEFEIK